MDEKILVAKGHEKKCVETPSRKKVKSDMDLKKKSYHKGFKPKTKTILLSMMTELFPLYICLYGEKNCHQ